MFTIGIIDDDKSERDDIQVSVMENFIDSSNIDFKEYLIEGRSKEELLDEIRIDIIENKINLLIVDFKLDTTAKIIAGGEILDFMHEETPEFPVIILTNVPDESKTSDSTDPDKVYAKKTFLDPSLPGTREQVRNMQLNMEKYMKHRQRLEAELAVAINKYQKDKDADNVMGEIVEIENELSKYKQIYQSSIDKDVNVSNLEKAFEILKKLKAMDKN